MQRHRIKGGQEAKRINFEHDGLYKIASFDSTTLQPTPPKFSKRSAKKKKKNPLKHTDLQEMALV